MKLYFSYGSNMSRERLEVRTGPVVPHGLATLADYQHCFSHRGADGSGKGNIASARGMQVHGVLYAMSLAQVNLLHSYEGGYEVIDVLVSGVLSAEPVAAYTYCNRQGVTGLSPLASYIEHYLRGMLENNFPQEYIDTIRKQSGL